MIRLASSDDARGILDIYAPIVANTTISFEYDVPTLAEMRTRIDKVLPRYPWFVCEMDNTIAGYAYGSTHRTRTAYQWSVEVSAYVHPDYRKRRIGQALYAALFDLLIWQGYYNAFAGITLPNDASVGFHESMGFTQLGIFHNIGYKFAGWHDTGWYERQLCGHDVPAKMLRTLEAEGAGHAIAHAIALGEGCVGA